MRVLQSPRIRHLTYQARVVSHQPPQTAPMQAAEAPTMTRPWLIVLALSLVLAVSMAARRKPAQLACAADTYARAVTTVKNLARRGRGQAPISCAADHAVAGLP